MFSCQARKSTPHRVGSARLNHSGKSSDTKLILPKFMAGPLQNGTYGCKIERIVTDKKIRVTVEILRAVKPAQSRNK